MKSVRNLALLLFPLLTAALLCARDKSNLPRQIVAARYVYVTDLLGRDEFDATLPEPDRRALADVEQALRKWGRYLVTLRPEEAELIIAVRPGRVVAVHADTAPIGLPPIGSRRPIGADAPNLPGTPSGHPGIGAGADVGPSSDLLEVHDAHLGLNSSPLYRNLKSDGLQPPAMSLIKELRAEVEKAEKEDQNKKKKSP